MRNLIICGILCSLCFFVLQGTAAPSVGQPTFGAPGAEPPPGGEQLITYAGDKPTVYTIELKYLTVQQALQILKGEGSRLAPFVPKGITDIVGVEGTQNLLIPTADPEAIIRLMQLIAMIDQPNRVASLQVMLVLLDAGTPEDSPAAGEKTLIPQTLAQSWVRSLLEKHRAGVILLPDVQINQPSIRVQVPSFLTDPLTIFLDLGDSAISDPEKPIPAQLTVMSGDGSVVTDIFGRRYYQDGNNGNQPFTPSDVSLKIGQTLLVPVQLPAAPEKTAQRVVLLITPVPAVPVVPAGLASLDNNNVNNNTSRSNRNSENNTRSNRNNTNN